MIALPNTDEIKFWFKGDNINTIIRSAETARYKQTFWVDFAYCITKLGVSVCVCCVAIKISKDYFIYYIYFLCIQ